MVMQSIFDSIAGHASIIEPQLIDVEELAGAEA
jgi:hypothetical protein